jgi:hypothetical protein
MGFRTHAGKVLDYIGSMNTYDIEQYQGDTFNGANFTISVNASPLDLSAASISMKVRSQSTFELAATLSLGAGLTVTNGAGGVFRIDPQIFPMGPGTFLYDIQITIGTTVKTYVRGTITITPDVTHA